MTQSINKVKLADIAERTGLSPATISLVLRNKGDIHPDTRTRVLDAARAMGYRSKSVGPARNNGHVKNIGLIVKSQPSDPPLANPFYSHVVAGIEAACRPLKINVLYATMPVDDNYRPTEVPNVVAEADVDGLLLVGAFVDETLAHVLMQRQVPVVLVDGYSRSGAFDAVVSDNVQGARRATAYLLDRGHRQIGMVGGRSDAYPSLTERRLGYLKAIEERGLQPHFADCASVQDAADVAAATRCLLEEFPGITAIFGCNDSTAIASMRAAREIGRRSPDDLSFVGFDDIDGAHMVTPALTTMRVDKPGMGMRAFELLHHRISRPESAPGTLVLQPTLIERESVATLS